MNFDVKGEEIIRHADINYWVHECNRYLFLAKVHLKDKSINPLIDGDPINFIDNLINLSQISTEDGSSHKKFLLEKAGEESIVIPVKDIINFKFDLPKDEISILKQTFEQISTDDWDNIKLEKIESAQEILCKSLKSMETFWESISL